MRGSCTFHGQILISLYKFAGDRKMFPVEREKMCTGYATIRNIAGSKKVCRFRSNVINQYNIIVAVRAVSEQGPEKSEEFIYIS